MLYENYCKACLFSILLLFLLIVAMVFNYGCEKNAQEIVNPEIDRNSKLPYDIIKRTHEGDHHPPILHSEDYEYPVALGSGINTSGAEDSPFILPDGNTLYFFFTPDVRIPPERQILDSVTGIWVSYKINDEWSDAVRVWLQDPGKLALDGAVAIQDDEMWFASAREGYTGVNMWTAELVNGKWKNWKYSGDRLMKEIQIGEVHLHGNELYFHSHRSGGLGGLDIWKTIRNSNTWEDPINITAANTPGDEGFPFISRDGTEIWFTRTHQGAPAIFRSVRNGSEWGKPELILSRFAGEPTLDKDGNIYFVHHFFENSIMIEADIYVAYRKR
jgi:hypothetical protein